MSSDLVNFVSAQLEEDERIARGTRQPGTAWRNFDMDGELRDDANAGTVAYVPLEETRAHIAAWDPARVLMEIEADRELLAEYDRLIRAHEAHRRESSRLTEAGDDDPIRRAALRREADYLPAMLHVLERWAKRKAAVYADRPGFREEWRP
ncbi:DUF6221 family protein [Streptomyces antibioticus]|uniref:DUF6221 family protein n=1 Tax=Streptomyces antibioticus TaxID=1890 RepID=UPI0036A09368